LLKEAKYDNSTESGSLQIVFTLPDSSLSSFLMVPRARSVAEGNFSLKYALKMKEENKRKRGASIFIGL